MPSSQNDRLAWWREARFGMMIHWGLYSLPAGEWQGQQMDYIGEWLQSRFRIPNAEYARFAAQFNPIQFDAHAWVRLAKEAGMRYMVFTAKHHDGFAMYHSPSDPYNIVDATPFGRDPVAELAEACRAEGVRLCLYYSHALDWHERDAGGTGPEIKSKNAGGMSWGNDWDFPDHAAKDYARYFEKKVKPQVREILTQYGPIGLLWFDCPFTITQAQGEELVHLVRSLQPDCIINGRIGYNLGDYGSFGDNAIPLGTLTGNWETPATLNDTWGYKRHDHNWKSAQDVVALLTHLASKGVNYLLNIGPTPEGLIPAPSVNILREVGQWMTPHAQAIHGSAPSPYPYDFAWGRITAKPGKLYLHLQQWPRQGSTRENALALSGLRNHVRQAYLLSAPQTALPLEQQHDAALDLHRVQVQLPAQAPAIPVLALEIDGQADVDQTPLQQAGGSVILPAHLAARHGELRVETLGAVVNWHAPADWLSWTFKVHMAGRYRVKVVTSALRHNRPWKGGHRVRIVVGASELRATLEQDEVIATAATRCYAQAASLCGEIALPGPGPYELTLKADEIQSNAGVGLAVTEVQLEPASSCAEG
jgi:alpha-L-fucosidase